LQRAGYNVTQGVSEAVNKGGGSVQMGLDLESGGTSRASELWGREHKAEKGFLLATGSSGGQGEASIVLFTSAKAAEETAAEVEGAAGQKNGDGSEATPASEGVKVAWRDNGAWIAWTNGANTSEQIASCFP
jgi:hypothetical protein